MFTAKEAHKESLINSHMICEEVMNVIQSTIDQTIQEGKSQVQVIVSKNISKQIIQWLCNLEFTVSAKSWDQCEDELYISW